MSLKTVDAMGTSRKTLVGLVLVAMAVGCGPRLRKDAEAPKPAAAAEEAPVAQMTVQHDAAKVDENKKYTADGQFTVEGLFFKSGAPEPATVKVSLREVGGQKTRSYDLELANLGGASAKVEMWDDGFVSVSIPEGGAAPVFQTSNTSVKAATVEVPGGEPRTCYFGKQILEGQLRFALCDLQATPSMAFMDALAEPADATAPAADEAPAAATP